MGNFPVKTEVWTTDGELMRMVNDRPLIEAQPSMRDATSPGVRSILWRTDDPATLLLVEALDEGDPRKTVPKRDRVSMLKAPFTGQIQPFVDTEMRFGGVQWLSPKVALLSDFSAQKTAFAHLADRSVAARRRHAAAALGLQHRGPHRRAGQPDVPVRPRERSPAAGHQP